MGAVLARNVEGHPRNISVKFFAIQQLAYEEMSYKDFFSILSYGGHFVQRSKPILAVLVKGHPRNISVKIF